MDYDAWKTGWYDAEPEIDHEDCYYHNHEENREAIKDLIDALYAEDELNIEFIKERLDWLARDYDVDFDRKKPMGIEDKTSEDAVLSIPENDLFQTMAKWTIRNAEIINASN